MAFSTLIAAAWHLVDHLADHGWEIMIRRVPGRPSYTVQMDKHTGHPADIVTVEAPPRPWHSAWHRCGLPGIRDPSPEQVWTRSQGGGRRLVRHPQRAVMAWQGSATLWCGRDGQAPGRRPIASSGGTGTLIQSALSPCPRLSFPYAHGSMV